MKTSLTREKQPPAKAGKERVPRRNTLRHRSQTDKRERRRPNTESSQGTAAKTHRGLASGHQLIAQQKLYRPGGKGKTEQTHLHLYKVMKEKNLQLRILYPARFSFRSDGEIKSFPEKPKLKEFSITKPALRQILKELL